MSFRGRCLPHGPVWKELNGDYIVALNIKKVKLDYRRDAECLIADKDWNGRLVGSGAKAG